MAENFKLFGQFESKTVSFSVQSLGRKGWRCRPVGWGVKVRSGIFEICGVVLAEMNVSRNVAIKNLLSFKGDFTFGKTRCRREPNLCCRRTDRRAYAIGVEWAGAICDVAHLFARSLWIRRSHSTKLSQRRLTAELLAPPERHRSRMHSKVSSDWPPKYMKATRPVLEIVKMAGYFPDSPLFVNNYLFVLRIIWNTQIRSDAFFVFFRLIKSAVHKVSMWFRGLITVGTEVQSSRITACNWRRPDCLSAKIKEISWLFIVEYTFTSTHFLRRR